MMIATESITVKKKLRIKFAGKRFDAPTTEKYELEPDVSVPFNGRRDAVNENGQNEASKMVNQVVQSSSNLRLSVKFKKRQPPEVAEGPRKKLRMDKSVAQQCSSILRKLLKHKLSWPFKQPVDPIKLQIPDYFLIILKPMDLGTVKFSLDKHMYHGPEEFAADVRLTFSNAMRYNPPSNEVHNMAAALSNIFESAWRDLEAKWSCGEANVEPGNKHITELGCRGQNGPTMHPHSGLLKYRLQEKVKSDQDTTVVRVKVPKLVQDHVSKPLEGASKGTYSDERNASSSKSGKYVSHSKCDACGTTSCRCNNYIDSSLASSDFTSTRSLTKSNELHALKVERRISTMQASKSDRGSDDIINTLDKGNIHSSAELVTPATDAACEDGCSVTLRDVQLSPQKALRAAILKSRFAGTILKAQQKTLLEHGGKADPLKLHQEKEKLERRQQEEAARIEAQIKAAREKAEAESRRQREEAREAARIALEEMEKTVDIWESPETLKELEMLSGSSVADSNEGCVFTSSSSSRRRRRILDLSPGRKVLESLGLYLDYDFVEYDDDDDDDDYDNQQQEVPKHTDDGVEEEGEICP